MASYVFTEQECYRTTFTRSFSIKFIEFNFILKFFFVVFIFCCEGKSFSVWKSKKKQKKVFPKYRREKL